MSRQSINFRRLFSISPIARSFNLSLKQPNSWKVTAERYRKAHRQTKRQVDEDSTADQAVQGLAAYPKQFYIASK